MANNKINFSIGDMWLVVGSTGTGKTTVGKYILKGLHNVSQGALPVYIMDTKLSGDFTEFHQKGIGCLYTGDEHPPLRNKDNSPFIVWQPESDDLDNYDSFFEKIYRNRKPCVVYIDEVSSILGSHGNSKKYYKILLKQGRGLGISVMTNTQMARWLPSEVLTQIMHAILMRVTSVKDEKVMADIFDSYARKDIPHQHGFFYRDLRKPLKGNPPVYYKNVKELF
jgi:Cdc6-like AAA superfamily ATPase